MSKLVKATPTHLEISPAGVALLLWTTAVVGVTLAAIGVRAALLQVGLHSPAGAIIQTAAIIAGLAVAGVVGFTAWTARKRRRA